MIQLSKCQDAKTWNEFLSDEKGNQLVTIAHNPSLGPILEKTFGYESQNMVIEKDSKLVGVLPVVKVGKKMVSMPHFSYGGPIITSKEQLDIDLESVFENKKFEARSFKKLTDFLYDKKVTSIIPLKSSAEEQIMVLKSGFRRKIRKAEKLNYRFENGGAELLDDFFKLYITKMHQKGSPPMGKIFFENLLADYEYGEAKIAVIYDEERAIAAGFTLSYLGFNELCWVSSDHEYDRYNINSLLYWNMVKDSIKKKHLYFSMGRSTINSNNHNYKKQWLPIEKRVFYNYSQPIGKPLKEFTFLTKLWKFQPLKTSVYFGHIISKYVY